LLKNRKNIEEHSKSPALKHRATSESSLQDSNWNFVSYFSLKTRSLIPRYALRLFALSVLTIITSSCSLFEEDKGNYLTGKINYLGSSGDKNVKVSLYNYPQINDTLLNLSIQYPNIGAKISRELLFDKNSEPAVKSTNSDKDGNWEMTDLDKGEFVVVYNKEHAFEFQYGISVGSGETEAGNQSLDTAWVFLDGSVIESDLTFAQNSNIYIQGSVSVDEFSKVIVEDGVKIAFSDSTVEYDKGALNVLGVIEFNGAEDNYIHCFGENDELIGGWNRIKISGDVIGTFKYTKFLNAKSAIFYLESFLDVENCIFNNCEIGIKFELNHSGIVKNNLFTNSKINGIFGNLVDDFQNTNNLFYKNRVGLHFYGQGESNSFNNIFYDNYFGIRHSDNMSGVVRNCLFEKNNLGIGISGDFCNYNKNNFINNLVHDISIFSENNSTNSDPIIFNNNFFSEDIINIKMIGYNWGANLNNIDFRNNWLSGEIDSLVIENVKIFDKDDAGANADFTGQVLFMPVEENIIEDAGVFNK